MPKGVEHLKEKIIEEIKRSSAITFRDFMEMALYYPNLGYYCNSKEKIGRSGDYYTAANIDSNFGLLLAKQFLEMHSQLTNTKLAEIDNQDKKLTIIEIGAGTGQLALDILFALHNEYKFPLDKLQYLICEISPSMKAKQKQLLEPFAKQVNWISYEGLSQYPQAIIFANEVVDALPVHQVRWYKGQLQELYITLDSDGFSLKKLWQKPSSNKLASYLKVLNIGLIGKQIIEINLEAIKWLEQLSKGLEQGFIVIIDYGDHSDHLYSPENLEGSLRCFFQHTVRDNVLENIGEQDITSEVNFSALIYYGKELGLELVTLMRQSDYLIKLGLLERLQKIIEDDPNSFQSLKTRLALKNFFVPGGISDHFKVLVQRKG